MRLNKLLSILLLVSLLTGCAPAPTPLPTRTPAPSSTATPAPTATRAPTATPTPAPTATPDPRTLPLTARAEGEEQIGNYPPARPFTVHFSRPLDPKSAAAPLLTYPDVPGKVTWSDANAALTFTPDQPFKAGQQVYLFLDRNLKDVDGRAFEKLVQWQLRAAAGPAVYELSPEHPGGNDLNPVYRITFTDQMDRASVERALSVRPALKLRLGWEQQLIDQAGARGAKPAALPTPAPTSAAPKALVDVLTVEIETPLTPGELYAFTLDGAAAARDGVPLDEAFVWTFAPDNVRFSASIAKDGLLLEANYALDMQRVTELLELDPPTPGAWSVVDDTHLRFEPKVKFAYSQDYTVRARQALPGPSGSAVTLAPIVANLGSAINDQQTHTNFGNLKYRFTFYTAMDPARTQAAVRLEPPVVGTFSWENSNTDLTFTPAKTTSGRRVTFTVGTGAADALGRPALNKPYVIEMWVGDYPFDFPDDNTGFGQVGALFQAVDADGPRAIQFSNPTGKAHPVTFQLAPLTAGDFARRYMQYYQYHYVYGSQRKEDGFGGLTFARTWKADAGATGFATMSLPADVPPGLYALCVQDNGAQNCIFVALTRQALLAKAGTGRVFAWVSDFNGAPLKGSQVRLYDDQGANLVEDESDSDGAWETVVSTGIKPALVLATRGKPEGISLSGDVAVAGLAYFFESSTGQNYSTANCWYSYCSSLPRDKARLTRAYIYTDRPIYRPGQEMAYKAILRSEDDARYALPPAGSPVTVTLLDAKGNSVASAKLATSAYGSVNGSFSLAEGAMLGNYTLRVEALGGSDAQTFSVQEYHKPEFEVLVKTSASSVVQGESIDVDVDVRYYTGEPVAGVVLDFEGFIQDYISWPWGSSPWRSIGSLGSLQIVTGADGHFHTSFPVQTKDRNSYYYLYNSDSWALQVTASDASGASISRAVRLQVFPAGETLQLSVPSYRAQTGAPVTVKALVKDIKGSPVAGRAVALTVTTTDYYSFREYSTSSRQSVQNVLTDASGQAELTFTPNGDGWISVEGEAKDNGGHVYSRTLYMFSSGGASGAAYRGLAVSAERSQYGAYETVRLRIESNFSGPALLTFERGSVLRAVPVTLTAPVTEVEQVLGDECIPNVFVRVSAWQRNDTQSQYFKGFTDGKGDPFYSYSLADASLVAASTEITVDSRGKQLSVVLSADEAQYAPGQAAQFTVKVARPDGKPARAEVSLALVDEAIFALKSDPAGVMLDAFYGLRASGVTTYDEMAPKRVMLYAPRGGGGGGPTMGEAQGSLRSQFADTALWLPAVQTDANGQATVKVTLPDNATRWRLTARAVTADTLVGEATLSVVANLALTLRAVLPNSLVERDRSELGALVTNTSNQPQSARVSFTGTPSVRLDPGATAQQEVTLQPGETKMVTWMVTAAGTGEAQVKFTASALDGSSLDALQQPLNIRPYGAAMVSSSSATLSENASLEWTAPLALPESASAASKVTLTLSRGLSGSLLKGLEDLTAYPYGCVEQIMSAALPNALVARAYAKTGLKMPVGDLEKKVSSGLQKLYAMQHSDGGWGWWTYDNSDDYMTAWVLFGLAATREAGYTVSPQVMDAGVKYFTTAFSNKTHAMDDRTRAFVLYALAISGKPDAAAAQDLSARAAQLDPFSQAALALALSAGGDGVRANAVLDLLARSMERRDGRAYWSLSSQDGTYHSKTMASGLRSTALALEAYLQLRSKDAAVAEIEAYLLANRRSFGWGSTNETAFAILALSDRLAQSKNDARASAFKLEINGRVLQEGKLEAGQDTLAITIPFDRLERGANLIHASLSKGSAPLYLTLTSRLFLGDEMAKAVSSKVAIRREYVISGQGGEANPRAYQNALVEVHLIYTLTAYTPYIMIEDPLPGGMEAINSELDISGIKVDSKDDAMAYFSRKYGYNRKEIRDGRVLFFITEGYAGTYTITYQASLTRPGVYAALPATITSMYDESVFARSEGARVEVMAKKP